MAKKKSKSKKGSSNRRAAAAPAPRERSPFVAIMAAIVLCLIAFFMLLGGFATGGALPIALFHGAYAAFGLAAFLVPFALGYWGVYKFLSEDKRMPALKLIAVVCTLLFAAGFLHVAFAAQVGSGAWQGGHGGALGSAVGGMVLGALDKIPASLLFLVATVLAIFPALGIPYKEMLRVVDLFKQPEHEGEANDLATLKARAQPSGFKVNDTATAEAIAPPVPTKPPVRLPSLRNSTPKMTSAENHEALTTASDPDWQLPSVGLLSQKQDKANPGDVNANAQMIHDTFANFNIDVEMEGANIGPRVTQYTMKPPTGVKLTRITALENNLALDLAATSIRMEAPIPGKRAVGIEVPNVTSATVRISSLFLAREWTKNISPLSFGIGKDISGTPVVEDLAKMPHLLVAGQTGSGKSVMINTILTSLLYRNSPSDLKLILVDPKQVEMAPYEGIPHLLTPVITEPEKCISALKWAVAEMERRYTALADEKKRNIIEYNNLKKEEGMPYIVIIIDELADLMMMAARDVEALIVRIAQKARAVGIHLILATQRPSVDVITGLIKANVPARIAFTVASQVDSRTIIDQPGAEKLLGMGDMLLLTSNMPKPKRIQGAFISDDETAKVVDFIKAQREPSYNDEVVSQPVQLNGKGGVVADMGGSGDGEDDMFRDAVGVVIESGKASTSLLQRRLRIGYGRAARIIEQMEEQGIIGHADGSRPRDVLVTSVDQVFGGGAGDEVLDENFDSEQEEYAAR